MIKPLFEVDARGFAKIQADVPKWRSMMELVQNGFDAADSRVSVQLEKCRGGWADFTIEDDGPGFADLSHSYTLFAQSTKASNRHARGWMNLGEKLAIVGCHWLEITTTSGHVKFDMRKLNRVEKRAPRRQAGTVIRGRLKINGQEFDQCEAMLRRVLTPEGLIFVVNGQEVVRRTPLKVVYGKLQTRYADQDGVPRIRTIDDAGIEIVEVLPGETSSLYEMGLPVVEIGESGGKWHVNALQKVPLGKDRDGVPPAFLTSVRVMVLNQMHSQIDDVDACAPWVVEASSDERITRKALEAVVEAKFGKDAVIASVIDEEPNRRAVAVGVQPVRGAHLTRGQWDNIRRHDLLPKAADRFPSPKPYGGADGSPVEAIPARQQTPGMKRLVAYTAWVCREILGHDVTVQVVQRLNDRCQACYGQRTLVYSLNALGQSFFEGPIGIPHDDLIIHEAAHEIAANHLSEEYYRACTLLGARFVQLALEQQATMLKLRTSIVP